jgi:hypothetical protein
LKLAYHNAIEGTLKTGPVATSILLGAQDANLNTGYLRILSTVSLLQKSLGVGAGYRANVFDVARNKDAVVLNRFILSADYQILSGLRPYVEIGFIENTKGVIQKNVTKDYVVPVVIGTTIPAGKILDAVVAEIEVLSDRKIGTKDMPVQWNLYIDKKLCSYARFEFGFLSDAAAGDPGKTRLALRYTGSLK